MLPEGAGVPRQPMADFWNTDWLHRSEIFAPLRKAAAGLPEIGWPDVRILNAIADGAGRIVNAQGQAIRFVPQRAQSAGFEEGFEPRTYLKGEVQVRELDWHDLFNALVWMTFPTAKAVINARHYEALSAEPTGKRSRPGDALTLFDEDGIVVLSSDATLLELIRQFRWKELFWERREEVSRAVRFFAFGHALYQKALNPFVGMTGNAILLDAPASFIDLSRQAQLAAADRLLSSYVWDKARMTHGRELSPLPLLGVPGWWPGNEQEAFYDNRAYFRSGRRSGGDQPPSPSA